MTAHLSQHRAEPSPRPAGSEEVEAELEQDPIASLRALSQGPGDDVLGQVVGGFLSRLPARLSEMRSSLDRGDLDALRELAHALKGTAPVCGAADLGELCSQLERALDKADVASAQGLMQGVEEESRRTEARLRKLLAEEETTDALGTDEPGPS